jgi:hypothetical protein
MLTYAVAEAAEEEDWAWIGGVVLSNTYADVC